MSVSGTMHAVLLTGYGGIEKLVYRKDVPIPQPGAGEVLVKVGACGINNTDVNLRARWYDRAIDSPMSEDLGREGAGDTSGSASWNQSTIGFPLIQGAAVVGRIVAVGPGMAADRVGERVIVDPQVRDLSCPARAQLVAYMGGDRDGGFAEYVAMPGSCAHAIDSPYSDAELATFPCSYDTAEEMLERARLSCGETVVITGAAGGVGTALIQLSLLRGARVVAVAGASKEARIRALGAREFIARETTSLKAAVERVVGQTGVDVVADVVGGPIFGDLLKVLRRGGRYTTAGAIAGPVQAMDLRDLIYKDLEMYGITCPTGETFARIVAYIRSGRLKPLLEKTFPLELLAQAQLEFLKRKHFGKFVVIP